MSTALDPSASPRGFLGTPDKRYIARINNIPAIIGGVTILLFLFAIVYGYNQRLKRAERAAEERKVRSAEDSANTIIAGHPDGLIQPTILSTDSETPIAQETRGSLKPESLQDNASAQQDKVTEEYLRRRLQRRLEMHDQAMRSGGKVNVEGMSTEKRDNARREMQNVIASLMQEQGEGPGPGSADRMSLMLQRLAGMEGRGDGDSNGQSQDRKNAFLEDKGLSPSKYKLDARREISTNPYELKTGALIPCVMVGGVNSDLPGVLRAQVSQNVYDTGSGNHLLIPQGSFLMGQHDSHVNYGQERVLVQWNRITYPDGSTHDIGVMPGADQAGYPGFTDQVNNHYFRTFGGAILMSIISAGVQLSQPKPQPFQGQDIGQTLGASLGQNLGQLGMEITRRNLNIQPTLEIRPGYRFNVVVTKDLSFSEPYRARLARIQEE